MSDMETLYQKTACVIDLGHWSNTPVFSFCQFHAERLYVSSLSMTSFISPLTESTSPAP